MLMFCVTLDFGCFNWLDDDVKLSSSTEKQNVMSKVIKVFGGIICVQANIWFMSYYNTTLMTRLTS